MCDHKKEPKPMENLEEVNFEHLGHGGVLKIKSRFRDKLKEKLAMFLKANNDVFA